MGTDFQSWLRRPAAVLLLLLILVAIPMLREINKGELHLNVDETRHAMGGVFLHDFLRDFPLRWPLQYAYEYYGKYPAVSIGHWPPGFYFIEAIFFMLFGIAVWVSRLAVVVFALMGAVFWYKMLSKARRTHAGGFRERGGRLRCRARPTPTEGDPILEAG